jgi:hypothetical protein
MNAEDMSARLQAIRADVDDFSSASLNDEKLARHLVELEHTCNALEAAQADVMVEMRDRAVAADLEVTYPNAPASTAHKSAEFVVDEIAVLLSCTKVAASYRFCTADRAHHYPGLLKFWRAGRIDGRKVDEITEALQVLDEPNTVGSLAVDSLLQAAAVYATSHTRPQLRAWLKRRVIDMAPESAERRRQRARADRRVEFTPVGDGMAELWALLPAESALHIKKLVEAQAFERAADDRRTIDQRRADALVDLVTADGPPPSIDISIVVPSDVLDVESDEPGELGGYGPVTAAHIREIVEGANTPGTGRVLVADPETGGIFNVVESRYRPSRFLDRSVRLRDLTCRFPGCRRYAVGRSSGIDLDHTRPWPEGATTADNLAALCRHHHRVKHEAGWSADLRDDGSLIWTSPSGRTAATHPWDYLGVDSDPDPPDG